MNLDDLVLVIFFSFFRKQRYFKCIYYCFRYLFQYYPQAEDVVLHSESDRTLRRNIVFVRSSVLSAGRFRRENCPMYIHSSFANDVLPSHIRNHPINILGSPPSWQILIIYDGIGRFIGRYNYNYIKRTLSQTEHPQDGSLGQVFLYQAGT